VKLTAFIVITSLIFQGNPPKRYLVMIADFMAKHNHHTDHSRVPSGCRDATQGHSRSTSKAAKSLLPHTLTTVMPETPQVLSGIQ